MQKTVQQRSFSGELLYYANYGLGSDWIINDLIYVSGGQPLVIVRACP